VFLNLNDASISAKSLLWIRLEQPFKQIFHHISSKVRHFYRLGAAIMVHLVSVLVIVGWQSNQHLIEQDAKGVEVD
jgi:hypothetical protein